MGAYLPVRRSWNEVVAEPYASIAPPYAPRKEFLRRRPRTQTRISRWILRRSGGTSSVVLVCCTNKGASKDARLRWIVSVLVQVSFRKSKRHLHVSVDLGTLAAGRPPKDGISLGESNGVFGGGCSVHFWQSWCSACWEGAQGPHLLGRN